MILYRPNITGCSDHHCIFSDNRRGMHTNGGCSCRRALIRTPEGRKAALTIDFLRHQMRNEQDD